MLVTPLSFKPEDSLGGVGVGHLGGHLAGHLGGIVPAAKPLLLTGPDAPLWIEKRLADQVGPGAPGWRLSDTSASQQPTLPDYSEVVRLMAGDNHGHGHGQPARAGESTKLA